MASLLDTIKGKIYKAWYKAGELTEAVGQEVWKATQWAKDLVQDLKTNPVQAVTNLQQSVETSLQPVVETWKTIGKTVGAWLDTINPANLWGKLGTSIANKVTGKNVEYKPVQIGKKLWEAAWEVVASVPSALINVPLQASKSTFAINDEINDYKSWKKWADDVALAFVDEVWKTGLAAFNAVGIAKVPKVLLATQSIMKASSLDKVQEWAVNTIADSLSNALNVKDEGTRERVRSVINSWTWLASIWAGIKWGKIAEAPGLKSKVKWISVASAPDIATIWVWELLGNEDNRTEAEKEISNAQKATALWASLLTALTPGELWMAGKPKAKPSLDQGKFDIKEEPLAEATPVKPKVKIKKEEVNLWARVDKEYVPTEQRFTLPDSLKKWGWDYWMYAVDFWNDFYRALYVIRENKTWARSASDEKYLKEVMEQTGLSEKNARLLGNTVLKNIKDNEWNARKVPWVKKPVIKLDSNLFSDKQTTTKQPLAETIKEVIPVKAEVQKQVEAPVQTKTKQPLTETIKDKTTTQTPKAPTRKIEIQNTNVALPKSLAWAKVESFNYWADVYRVDFGNDINKALYIVKGRKEKKSASYPAYIKWLNSVTGLSEKELNYLWDLVHENIKQKIKNWETNGKNVSVDVDFFTGNKIQRPIWTVIEPQAKIVWTAAPLAETIKATKTKATKKEKTIAEIIKNEPTEEQVPFDDSKFTEALDKASPPYVPPKEYEPLKKDIDTIIDNMTLEDVTVSRSAKATDEAFTVWWLIERGIGKFKDGNAITFRNILQTVRNSTPLFVERLIKFFGYNLDSMRLNRKFEVTDDMVKGRFTPNENVEITGLKDIKNAIDNIIPDSLLQYISKETADEIRNYAKASYVYNLNKDNPDFISKTFTPEEVARFEEWAKEEKRISETIGNILADYGIVPRYMVENGDYVRYLLNQTYRDKMSVSFGKMRQKAQDEFDEKIINSIIGSAKKWILAEETGTVKGLEEVWVSTAKEKSKAEKLDLERIHVPELRALSYMIEAGRAFRNKAIVDNFKKFLEKAKVAKWKEKAEVTKFIKRLFPEFSDKAINMIIGIPNKSGKVKEVLSEASRFAVAKIMLWNVVTATQPIYSTLPRWVYYKAKSLLQWSNVSPKNIFQEDVMRDLWALWFTHPYEPFDTRRAWLLTQFVGEKSDKLWAVFNSVGKAVESWVAASSGAWLEYPIKASVALDMMKKALKDNGIETSSDARDVVAKWKEFSFNPDKKTEYLKAQDKIQEVMSFLGESNIFTKSNIEWIRSANFQALTGYLNGQVNKMLRDISVVTGKTEWSTDQKIAAWERLAVQLAIYATAIMSAVNIFFEDNDDTPLDEKIRFVMPMVHRMSGFTPVMMWDLITNITNTPATSLVQLVKDIFWVASASMFWDEEWFDTQIAFGRLVDNLTKSTWVLKTASGLSDIITGKTIQEYATWIWAFNMEDISASWKARGRNTETTWEAVSKFLWFDLDNSFNNFLFDKIDRTEYNANLQAKWMSPVVAEAWAEIATVFSGMMRDLLFPINNLTGMLDTKWNEWYDMRDMAIMAETARKLTDEDSFRSYLWKFWITDNTLVNLVASEAIKKYPALAKNNREDALAVDDVGYTLRPIEVWDNFGKVMSWLMNENPKMFNDIMTGFKNIYKEKEEYQTYTPENWEKIKKAFTPALMWDDAAIASFYGTAPNSTSLWVAISRWVNDIMWTQNPKGSGKTDVEFKAEQLRFIDDIFRSVYQMHPISESVEKSLALKATEITTTLKAMAKTMWNPWAYSKFLDNMPWITKAIENGLTYRGFRKLQNNAKAPEEITQIETPKQETWNDLASTIRSSTKTVSKPLTTEAKWMIDYLKAYNPMKLQQVASPIRKTTTATTWWKLADLLKNR